jgi:hypothetical protein
MLRGQDRRQWKGTYDLHFNHHNSVNELKDSAAHYNCGICRSILVELRTKLDGSEPVEQELLAVSASITGITSPESKKLWRLDFKIRYAAIRCRRTFILKEASE